MNKTTHTAPAAKDFSKTARATLARKGIAIIGSTWLPGTDGTFANGERGYTLSDNGTQRIRTYAEVVALAA